MSKPKLSFVMEDFKGLFEELELKFRERKYVVGQLENTDYAAGVINGMNFMLERFDSAFVDLWNKKALEHNKTIGETKKEEDNDVNRSN